MTDSTKCPQCGGELPANFPPGVCPACLLRQGMSPSTLTGAAGEASGASGSPPRRSWTPPTPAELAPKFPQLEIVELLGQGGMGAVYKVRQRDLDRWAALKILPGDVANDPNFAERFQREARALAQLSHQHIVTVYEFGQREGVFFLLMEFVDGVTLRQAIRAGTSGHPVSGRALAAGLVQSPAASALPLTGNDPGLASPPHSPSTATISAPQALAIVAQICDALQFAHEEGIVHRDIKPENILIDKRGRVKIADFGLAKLLGKQASFPTLTGTHQIMGTPVYMAPEQMEGSRSIDHRADIFSLGVVFYELLTGELPLGRFAPPSQKYSLDVRLDEVVLRTLEKNPDRRYQQASDVKLDVDSIRSQPAALKPSKVMQPRQPWSLARMVTLFLIAVMGAFTCLAGPFVVARWFSHDQGFEDLVNKRSADLNTRRAALYVSIAQTERQRVEQQLLVLKQQFYEAKTRDPLEANALVQFTSVGVKLHPHAFGTGEMTSEQRVTLEKILTDIHREYFKIEAAHSQFATDDGVQTVTIDRFDVDLAKLENELWTAVDSQLPIAVQKLLRQQLPLFADPDVILAQVGPPAGVMGGDGGVGMAAPPAAFGSAAMGGSMSSMGALGTGGVLAASNLRYQQLLGWRQTRLPLQITIRARGKWRRWEIGAEGTGPPFVGTGGQASFPKTYTVLDSGEAPELPSGLRRFWRESASPNAGGRGSDQHYGPLSLVASYGVAGELGPKLLKLDGLRAADKTPWEDVEKQTKELLAKYTLPADKGRIHWMAAHVYGQSDIRGHAADVILHAFQALKYERDPIQRGWLFMYLGSAAEVLDSEPNNFVTRRTDATRWYLKGYLELLPFILPDKAPELTVVNKLGERAPLDVDGGVHPDQIAAEVVHAAQLKARQDAEFTRELVSRRGIYFSRLQDLYGRMHELYDKEADARARLSKVATELPLVEAIVADVLNRVWPDDPLDPPPQD